MGSLALQLIDTDANLKLHASLNSKSDLAHMLGADVVIDFTLPEVSPKVVEYAIKHDLKIVVGTSGLSEIHLAEL